MLAAQNPPALPIFFLIAALIPLLFSLLIFALFASLVGPWLRGFLSGAPVSIMQLIGMRFRGVPPRIIIDALVTLVHRGHSHDPQRSYVAESIYLARRSNIDSGAELADIVEKQLSSSSSGHVGV